MASIELRSPINALLQNLTENNAAAQAEHASSFNVVCCYITKTQLTVEHITGSLRE